MIDGWMDKHNLAAAHLSMSVPRKGGDRGREPRSKSSVEGNGESRSREKKEK